MKINFVNATLKKASLFSKKVMWLENFFSDFNQRFFWTKSQDFVLCNDIKIWIRLHNVPSITYEEPFMTPIYIAWDAHITYSKEELEEYLETISEDHLLYDIVNKK